MSHLTAELTLDRQNETARLDVTISGIITTSYSYANDRVELAPLASATTLPLEELETLIFDERRLFENEVQQHFKPKKTATTTFAKESKKQASSIEAKLVLAGQTVTDLEWQETTNEVVFQPRASFDLAWTDFVYFFDFLRSVTADIRGFSL